MKAILFLVAIICVAVAPLPWDEHESKSLFAHFKTQYKKEYATIKEEQLRYRIFSVLSFDQLVRMFGRESMARAKQEQAKNPKARFGVTKFSDLTPEEFSRRYKMPDFDPAEFPRLPVKDFSKSHPPLALPGCSPDSTTFDWSKCGVITKVYGFHFVFKGFQFADGVNSYDQKKCTSGWAFSATETIESYFAIGGGKLTQLSMQQLIDCDTFDSGCAGGYPSSAYSYVQEGNGLEALNTYPYLAANGTCHFKAAYAVAFVTSQQSISGENGLYQQLSTDGPVSVCVDSSSWQDYQGGLLTQCGNDVDHCVQLTGYGNFGESGAFWNVRNSWGVDWGMNGYIQIEMGQDLCSIGDYATIVSVNSTL